MAKKTGIKEILTKEIEQDSDTAIGDIRRFQKKPLLSKRDRKELGIGKDEGRAVLKHARISPRKVKIVLDIIKGKDIDEAYGIIKYTPKAASELLLKLLKSAVANAENNNGLDRDELYVAEAYVDQGPTLKRIRARAQGRAFRIRKRTSHITLVLRERD